MSKQLVECYVRQLNQVFTNILTNAIDALEEQNKQRSFQELLASPREIQISKFIPSYATDTKRRSCGRVAKLAPDLTFVVC